MGNPHLFNVWALAGFGEKKGADLLPEGDRGFVPDIQQYLSMLEVRLSSE